MKLNRLETHDRLLHFKKDQALNLSQGFDDCLKRNPLSLALQDRSPYVYIYAHPRTADDGVSKRMIFQPRLKKPVNAETNSYLCRAKSKTDELEVVWLLPPRETWAQFEKGKVTEDDNVMYSINMYMNDKKKLEEEDPEDLPDHTVRAIYTEIKNSLSVKVIPKLMTEEDFSSYLV